MSEILDVMIFGYSIKVWELFAVFGVVLCIFEIFTPAFVLLPVGLAFLATALGAVFLNSWISILALLSISLVFLIWLFHTKIKPSKTESVLATNVDSLVGKELVVTKEIKDGETGELKLYGDRWNAYSLSKESYSVGDRVTVVKVDGNKVAVD